MNEKAQVLLADDHPVVRAGYRYLLEKAGYRVNEVGSAESAYQYYQQNNPDIVIMDISMPGMGGLEGLRRLLARYPDARVLMLSMYEDHAYVLRTRELGAKGYLTKNSAAEELVEVVAELLRGKTYYLKDTASSGKGSSAKDKLATYNLSTRQFEIFCMLAEGRSVVDIARDLNLSPKTVNNHRSHILTKLQLNNSVELSRFAIRHGIINA